MSDHCSLYGLFSSWFASADDYQNMTNYIRIYSGNTVLFQTVEKILRLSVVVELNLISYRSFIIGKENQVLRKGRNMRKRTTKILGVV